MTFQRHEREEFYEHLPETGGPGAAFGGLLFLFLLVAALAGAVKYWLF